MTAKRYLITVLALTVVGLSGCGSSNPTGTISGKVFFDGKPLRLTGSVVFYPEKGNPKGTVIGPDGAYRLEGVALGPARIEVKIHSAVPPGLQVAPGSGSRPEPKTPVPTRYADRRESGLLLQVRKGD